MTNLATNLTTTAAKYPEQAALRVNGQGVTYAQLHGMAAKVAGALRANGIQPGDRVGDDAAQRAGVPGRLLRASCWPAASSCR